MTKEDLDTLRSAALALRILADSFNDLLDRIEKRDGDAEQ